MNQQVFKRNDRGVVAAPWGRENRGAFRQAFATHAGITPTHARGSWRNGKARQNLERALETSGIIDRADGVLMARTGTDADQPVEALRRASQRSKRKVSDLAKEIGGSTRRNVQVSE